MSALPTTGQSRAEARRRLAGGVGFSGAATQKSPPAGVSPSADLLRDQPAAVAQPEDEALVPELLPPGRSGQRTCEARTTRAAPALPAPPTGQRRPGTRSANAGGGA